MLQGVHELYDLNETPQLWEENPRINRLVFIGEHTHLFHICIFTQFLHATVKAASSLNCIKLIKMTLFDNLLLIFSSSVSIKVHLMEIVQKLLLTNSRSSKFLILA